MSAPELSSSAGESEPRYDFYGRLKGDFPSQVIVDLTEICNLACIHCPHPVFKQSEYYSGKSLRPELNQKLVDEVATASNGSTQYIRYTGEGEPLIHPQSIPMMRYAKEHSGVTVTLTTNGTLLDERRIDGLIEARLDVIDISIDAFKDETYSRIRVRGDLKVTRGNVLALIRRVAQEKSKTKVVVSYVEQELNHGETEAFEKFWKDEGAEYVIIRRLHSAAGAVPAVALKMRSETQTPRRPCVYPWERVVLNPRGFLSFCPADWTLGSTIVDYSTTTVAETWKGAFYIALREAHVRNDFARHQFCGQCPDWAATRWPQQGRAYADMIEDFKATE